MQDSAVRLAALLALCLLAGAAWAEEPAGSTEAEAQARRYFDRGRYLYGKGDYKAALRSFERARQARPLPGFDFHIGRCHDQLGHLTEAIAAYERFLAVADDPEVDARLEVLRARAASQEAAPSTGPPRREPPLEARPPSPSAAAPSVTAPPPFNAAPSPSNAAPSPSNAAPSASPTAPSPSNAAPSASPTAPSPSNVAPSPATPSPAASPPAAAPAAAAASPASPAVVPVAVPLAAPAPPRRRSLAGPLVLGIAGLALTAAGVGLTVSVGPEYNALASTCAPRCAPARWGDLQTREQAGIALLAVGGAALAADIVWWIVATRGPRTHAARASEPLGRRLAGIAF